MSAQTPSHLPALKPEQVRRFRMLRSGLIDPFSSAAAASAALVGVQAQILQAAGLALWNRTRALTNAEFERLLYVDRTLVKLWGQRGTLHLYASAEWPLLYAARKLDRTWWERMAENNGGVAVGGDYRHKIEHVAEALRARASMGRSDLRALEIELHEELYSSWGGIFADLVRLGYACHAERAGSEGRFAHRERWLPDLAWNPPDPEAANVEIARRYFAAYGPATSADLAYWRGIQHGQARRWVAALGPELAEVRVEGAGEGAGAPLLALAADLETLAALPAKADGLPLRLLYRFDPLLLAHRDKGWVVPAEHYNRVWRPAGHIEGVLLWRGRATATWRYDRRGPGIAVTVAPFKPLPKAVLDRLPRLAAGVAGFFDLPLTEWVVA